MVSERRRTRRPAGERQAAGPYRGPAEHMVGQPGVPDPQQFAPSVGDPALRPPAPEDLVLDRNIFSGKGSYTYRPQQQQDTALAVPTKAKKIKARKWGGFFTQDTTPTPGLQPDAPFDPLDLKLEPQAHTYQLPLPPRQFRKDPFSRVAQMAAPPADELNVYTANREEVSAFVNRIKDLPAAQQQEAIRQFETSSAHQAPTISPTRLHKVVTGIPEIMLMGGGLWDPRIDAFSAGEAIEKNLVANSGKWLLNKYDEDYVQPIAAGATILVQKSIPGKQEVQAKYEALVEAGMDPPEAALEAYKTTELPPAVKGMIEIGTDLLTLSPRTALTAAKVLVKPVTAISKVGNIGKPDVAAALGQNMRRQYVQSSDLLPDFMNAEEQIRVVLTPDGGRKIAQELKGTWAGALIRQLNPNALAKSDIEQMKVLETVWKVEGQDNTERALAALGQYGHSSQVFGALDDAGRITAKGARDPYHIGKTVEDLLANPSTSKLTPEQRLWADQAEALYEASRQLAARNGMPLTEMALVDVERFVGRKVLYKVDANGDLIGSASKPMLSGNKYPAKASFEKHRFFEDIQEAIKLGYRYMTQEEVLYYRMREIYDKVAMHKASEFLLERVPWLRAAGPEAMKNQYNALTAAVVFDINRLKTAGRGVIHSAKMTENQRKAQLAWLDEVDKVTEKIMSAKGELQVKAGKEVSKTELKRATAFLNGQLRQLTKTGNQLMNKWVKVTAKDEQAAAKFAEVQADLQRRTDQLNILRPNWQAASYYGRTARYEEAKIMRPDFIGKKFDAEVGEEYAKVFAEGWTPKIKEALRWLGPLSVVSVNTLSRALVLTMDASVMSINLAFVAGGSPAAWAKGFRGMVRSLFDKTYHDKLLVNNRALLDQFPSYISSRGGVEMTEAVARGGVLTKGKGVVGLVRKAITPFTRSFNTALDEAGINLLKSLGHMAKTPTERREIADFINHIRGVISTQRLGVSQGQQAIEAAALLAPRYNRAIGALLLDLAKGNLTGKLAREYLLRATAGFIALAVPISLAQGESWEEAMEHLDINSPKFVTWNIAGQNVGPGTKIRSVLKLIGQAASEPDTLLERSMSNPALRFLRGNFAAYPGAAMDLITGSNFMGDPTRDGVLSLTKNVIAPRLMPIMASTMLLEGTGADVVGRPIRGGFEFGGWRASPEPLWQSFTKHAETAMKLINEGTYAHIDLYREIFGPGAPSITDWESMSPAQKDFFEKEDPEGSQLFQEFIDDISEGGRQDEASNLITLEYDRHNAKISEASSLVRNGTIDYKTFKKDIRRHNRDKAIKIDTHKSNPRYKDYFDDLKKRSGNEVPAEMAWREYQEIVNDPSLYHESLNEYNFAEKERRLIQLRKRVGETIWRDFQASEKMYRGTLPAEVQEYYAMMGILEMYWEVGIETARDMGMEKEYLAYEKESRSVERDQMLRNRKLKRVISRIDANRLRLRKRNAEIDSLLIQWYGYTWKHRQNRNQGKGRAP